MVFCLEEQKYKLQGNLPTRSIEWSMVRVISVMRVICFGALVCCRVFVGFVCFPLSFTPQIKDEVFEQVTAMCNIYFQLNCTSFLKTIQNHRPFLEQNKQTKKDSCC